MKVISTYVQLGWCSLLASWRTSVLLLLGRLYGFDGITLESHRNWRVIDIRTVSQWHWSHRNRKAMERIENFGISQMSIYIEKFELSSGKSSLKCLTNLRFQLRLRARGSGWSWRRWWKSTAVRSDCSRSDKEILCGRLGERTVRKVRVEFCMLKHRKGSLNGWKFWQNS